MPLPSRLRELVGTAAFWSDYLGDEVFGEPVSGLPDDPYLELPLSPQHLLRVGYFWRAAAGEDFIQATDLRLWNATSGRNRLLGWRQDDGHVHPHVLRWEEADLIGRLQARKDADLPHPGVPFLLLMPYVAPIPGSDRGLGLRLLDTALRSLGVFNERQIRYRLATFDPAAADSEWRQVQPFGWVCHSLGRLPWECGGSPTYSLRRVSPGPSSFPFKEWNASMREAERAVGKARRVTVEAQGPEPLAPPAERFELMYQLTQSEAAYATLAALRRALFQDGLGVCYHSVVGGWTFLDLDNPDAELVGAKPGDEYAIYGYGDPTATIRMIRRVVEDAGWPDVRLYQWLRDGTWPAFRRIPLGS